MSSSSRITCSSASELVSLAMDLLALRKSTFQLTGGLSASDSVGRNGRHWSVRLGRIGLESIEDSGETLPRGIMPSLLAGAITLTVLAPYHGPDRVAWECFLAAQNLTPGKTGSLSPSRSKRSVNRYGVPNLWPTDDEAKGG